MLCNALDGSEDNRGRAEAARQWDQLGMNAKRAAAVSDVEAAYAAGELTWDLVGTLVHPFLARGTLDEYKEGQEDEGEGPGGQSWSDRGEPSSAEDDLAQPLCCAGGTSADVSETGSLEQGQTAEKLRHVQRMILEAEDVGHPRIVMTLKTSGAYS